MKTFLSIDWDYFVDATTEERMMLFPDGGNENLASFLLDLIWSTRYSASITGSAMDQNRKIEDMGVLDKEYHLLKKYLIKQSAALGSIVISESHSVAYQMFSDKLSKGEKCNIINIDYHHDLYTNRPGQVDCGNWLSEMNQNGMLNQLCWVARDDSDDLPEEYRGTTNILKTTDLLGTLKDLETLDGVFLCRSGAWSPPHLDVQLIMLVKAFCKHISVKEFKLPSRYTKEFKTIVRQQHEQNKIYNQNYKASNCS